MSIWADFEAGQIANGKRMKWLTIFFPGEDALAG
jgi:hypothetical protein